MPPNLDWTEGNQPNLWIYGEAGFGKSYEARKRLGDKFYAKIAANKWWDKYKGEPNVLIDDFDKSHAYQIANLKIWADVYAFPVEIKYGNDMIRPKIIIITSNYSIKEIWPDPIEHNPILRRFKEIHKAVKWNATIDGVLKKKKTKAVKTLVGKSPKKVKKNHLPLKKPAMFKQNANGDIVKNYQDQLQLDKLIDMHIDTIPKLNEAQEVPKDKVIQLGPNDDKYSEKDIIEVADTISTIEDTVSSISEECVGCTNLYCFCNHLLWGPKEWDEYNSLNGKLNYDDDIESEDLISISGEETSSDDY